MANTMIRCQTSAGPQPSSEMQIQQFNHHQHSNEVNQYGQIQQQQQQHFVGISSPQLLRSKSLNDISNDSQISSFASHRFINLNSNNNNINDVPQLPDGSSCYPALDTVAGYASNRLLPSPLPLNGCPSGIVPSNQFFDPTNDPNQSIQLEDRYQNPSSNNNDHLQRQQMQQQRPSSSLNTYDGNYHDLETTFGNQTFNPTQNLNHTANNDGQINNQCSRMGQQQQQSSAGSLYNICNPMAINLEGVTEQIGNFHL